MTYNILFVVSLAACCYALYKIYERKCNIWVVTNMRVIDENGLFAHYAIESQLDKINNISYSQSLWGRLLGYGNVEIQTAAQEGATIYTGVENPKRLKETITTMQEEYKKSISKENAQEMAQFFTKDKFNANNNSIAGEIEKIFDLKKRGILSEDEYEKLKAKILNN